MSIRMIRLAALYLVIGVTMGIVMGTMHQFTLAPVHAHVNLLGFATLALAGLIYKAYPAAAETRLAHVHFWIHSLGLPIFMIGLALALTGHEAFMPLVSIGATVVFVGILVFAVNIWRTVRPAPRTAGMPATARAAA